MNQKTCLKNAKTLYTETDISENMSLYQKTCLYINLYLKFSQTYSYLFCEMLLVKNKLLDILLV